MKSERTGVEPADKGGLPRNFMVVRGHQQCSSGFSCQLEQEGKHSRTVLSVEIASWLIRKHDERLVRQRAHNGNPLLLASAQPVRECIFAVVETHALKQFPCLAFELGVDCALKLGRQEHVLPYGEGGDQVEELEYHANVAPAKARAGGIAESGELVSFNGDGTAIGCINPADKVQKGCLAAAAASQDSYEFASVDFQAYVVENNALLAVVVE